VNRGPANPFIRSLSASPPVAVAHRGASGLAPENTIASFRLAHELGCTAAELDVRACRDGTIVVMHDASVDRTTNGKGEVAELSWQELSSLDAGSWFDASFAGERVPRLEDALDFARGKLSLVVEIKSVGIEKQVVELVNDFQMQERCVIVSFHPEALLAVSALPAPLPTGWIVWAPRPGAIADQELVAQTLRAKARALVISQTALSARLVGRAHDEGLAVVTWTVNTASAMRRVLKMGADAVATNRPDILLGLLSGGS
jgi:glycerophosphoryl diester phosphodiesterase